MAKVIGFDNSVFRRATCINCGAVVEYAPNEVLKRVETDYTGCKDEVKYIRCPNCDDTITLHA